MGDLRGVEDPADLNKSPMLQISDATRLATQAQYEARRSI